MQVPYESCVAFSIILTLTGRRTCSTVYWGSATFLSQCPTDRKGEPSAWMKAMAAPLKKQVNKSSYYIFVRWRSLTSKFLKMKQSKLYQTPSFSHLSKLPACSAMSVQRRRTKDCNKDTYMESYWFQITSGPEEPCLSSCWVHREVVNEILQKEDLSINSGKHLPVVSVCVCAWVCLEGRGRVRDSSFMYERLYSCTCSCAWFTSHLNHTKLIIKPLSMAQTASKQYFQYIVTKQRSQKH